MVRLCDLDIFNFTLLAMPACHLAVVCLNVEEVVALCFRRFDSKVYYVNLTIFYVFIVGLILEKWVDLLYV